jgi:double zinc ribbon protein
MNRCRKCNTELTEQARFCNVCGSPQTPAGHQVEVSTSTKIETLDKTNRCHKCEAELPAEACFCNVCGSANSSKASSTAATTSEKQVTLASADADDKTLSGSSKSLTPTRSMQPGNKQPSTSKESGDNSIYPKTITRPPVFPSRPTNNGVKSPATPPQQHTLQPAISPEPATSAIPLNSSSPANAPETPEHTIQPETSRPANSLTPSSSAEAESISNTPTQSLGEPSVPARTPGLIRPIAPKSSASSVIPSRPDTPGTATATQQSKQAYSGYPISVLPMKESSPAKSQTQQRSSSSYNLPGVRTQDNKQNADLAKHQHKVSPAKQVSEDRVQRDRQEQIARNQMTPVAPISRHMSSTYDLDELPTSELSTEHINGQNDLGDTPTMDLPSPESFAATSKAAEHWRKSWLDRQYAEAGPAENVSRGQASVPMPLMAKRQSFARMRAIARNNKQQQEKRRIYFGTWITIFLMICLIAGLGAYIILSYLPNSPFGAPYVMPRANATQPTLTVLGTTSQTVKKGQTIQLHGEHFGAHHTITFLLDTATPVVDASGKSISTQANSQGTFDATLSIGSHWTYGSHSIEAIDNGSNRNASMTVQVIPAGTPATSSTELSVTMDNEAVQMLTFKAVIGQANPNPQRITITNTSGAPLKWTAAASSSNNLSWLNINDNNTLGQLDISQPHDMLISVNIDGLKSTPPKKPYTGQIVFTLNDNQLLTVPVQLRISDATPEMVFSPNPIIAQIGPGNTCNPGVTLTLINLGTAAISWSVNPDDNIKDKIKFLNNGQLSESGTLLPSGSVLPSGQPGDSVVLALQCNAIQVGRQYHVSVYANQISWSEFVVIQ